MSADRAVLLAGRKLAGSMKAGGSTRAHRYATVVANNGATLDVSVSGGVVPGVAMLTSCASAKAGDRCLLLVDGPLVTAIGILAKG